VGAGGMRSVMVGVAAAAVNRDLITPRASASMTQPITPDKLQKMNEIKFN